jgi:hypothetical protein
MACWIVTLGSYSNEAYFPPVPDKTASQGQGLAC